MMRSAKVERGLLTVNDNVVEAERFHAVNKGRQK